MEYRNDVRRIVAGPMALLAAILLLAAVPSSRAANSADPALIEKGRRLFFDETFDGNGRTCGTCHREERNFTIDAEFIAKLPRRDPLFVAETNPALRRNFEIPELMRRFGLILENTNGFDDLAGNFTMRSVPHTLAMPTSVDSAAGPRTGWSGDGAPNDGSLRAFAIGAVIQHFTNTLDRVPGVDFRLPTDAELDALEAFQLSLGRRQELLLPLPLKGDAALAGQTIFLDDRLGKCNICHTNAGANAGAGGNNNNFNTGVEAIANAPHKQLGIFVPDDDGFGNPGDGTFNTTTLVEAADTPPFFHNNAVATLEGAVAFYSTDAFNNSPSGQFLARTDPDGVGIRLDPAQDAAVAAFLRVINALENIRETTAQLQRALAALKGKPHDAAPFVQRALNETRDSIDVLRGAGLHPAAVRLLKQSRACARAAVDRAGPKDCPGPKNRRALVTQALAMQQLARAELIH